MIDAGLKLKSPQKMRKAFKVGVPMPIVDIENRRYIGSKAKLTNWIFENINKECSGNSFADIFAGTGVVAARAAQNFNRVILNDILYSNVAIYQGFFAQEIYSKEKVFNLVASYNSLTVDDLEETFFSRSFGGKFFSKETAKIIGHIRKDLEKRKNSLNNKEFHILLASLLYSADKVANTVGHYEAYFKKTASDRGFSFRLIEPLIKAGKVEIYRNDANKLVEALRADIVYIDPPYNSRQYSRFYHVLETLTLWDNPTLSGVALKRPPENMSDYCRNKATDVFADLVGKIKSKYIVVSYNNTYTSKSSSSRNKIELADIERILCSRGKTKVFRKDHKFFNTGKTDFKNHQEYLFITEL